MANSSNRSGFFVGEVLEGAARRLPSKTALIAREGQLTFAEVEAGAVGWPIGDGLWCGKSEYWILNCCKPFMTKILPLR